MQRVRQPERPMRDSVIAVGAALGIGSGAAEAASDAVSDPASVTDLDAALPLLSTGDTALMTVILGFAMFAVVAAVLLIRQGRRSEKIIAAQRAEIATLTYRSDRANLLLLDEPQILVSWGADPEPEIIGDISIVVTAPVPRRVLAFGTWLDPDQAKDLETAIEALRARGERFALRLVSLHGRHIEATGRPIAGHAVLRLRDMTGIRKEMADLAQRHERLVEDIEAMRGLIDALPAPIWLRDKLGRLVFVNPAYARAVDTKTPLEAVERGAELLDRSVREAAYGLRVSGLTYRERAQVVTAGSRRPFDIIDVPAERGSAGIALDASAEEQARADLKRAIDAHRGLLDQLSTGVAIFAANTRLAFYNSAYRSMWDLDPAFLDAGPTDSVILDQLRAVGRLPEPQNYREWKKQLHECYRAPDAKVHEPFWQLPDGRTIRVVTAPDATGGVIYLFDDITRAIDLERRVDSQSRVQAETLKHLLDGVAVFGTDGRLKLSNPRFRAMWNLAEADLTGQPHVEALTIAMSKLCNTPGLWAQLRGVVTGLDRADSFEVRFELTNGMIVDATAAPLADGQTLVSFHDVTAAVDVERALREGVDALQAADRIKNDFVQHVSYTLRTPLTTIIGYSQLLATGVAGPPSPQQAEFLGHISASTTALLAIIDNILNLASIDAGALELDLADVSAADVIDDAVKGLADRIAKQGLLVTVNIGTEAEHLLADRRMLTQVLFNLIDNAVAFSPDGARIVVSTQRTDADQLEFVVMDHGKGIPADMIDRVFQRFEARSQGADRRGAGLGLSIVRAFVELHGGRVRIVSAEGQGTQVACAFPNADTVRRMGQSLRQRRPRSEAAE